jgi:signal transduction histidine kinase
MTMPTVTFSPEQASPDVAPLYYAAAREQLRSLVILAGGLAHNVRSPLTAIMGRAEVIGVRQPELSAPMHEIVDQCERANAMLQAATAALKLRAERARRFVNLNEVVEHECAFMALDRHFKHEVDKKYVLADELPCVSAVYGTLAHAFAALVRNALIAMHDAAERRLVITTESDGGTVRLSVQDTGCGIAADHLPHVFEPGFTTLEEADAGPDGLERYGPVPLEGIGRGYGLAVAAAAVHEHRGAIEISSEPGAGTTAMVRLPVES